MSKAEARREGKEREENVIKCLNARPWTAR